VPGIPFFWTDDPAGDLIEGLAQLLVTASESEHNTGPVVGVELGPDHQLSS
jgi:hypothetical protein